MKYITLDRMYIEFLAYKYYYKSKIKFAAFCDMKCSQGIKVY